MKVLRKGRLTSKILWVIADLKPVRKHTECMGEQRSRGPPWYYGRLWSECRSTLILASCDGSRSDDFGAIGSSRRGED